MEYEHFKTKVIKIAHMELTWLDLLPLQMHISVSLDS